MTTQSNDHDPVATPGKAVPDAIGPRGDGDKSASDATPDTTTPGEASGKAQHPEAKEANTSTSPKVPGKSVPDAIGSGGKR
jgi:hypothetical protein